MNALVFRIKHNFKGHLFLMETKKNNEKFYK